MNWWGRLWNTGKLETELDAELRDHIERISARFILDGASEADARRSAILEFGGLAQIQEECRDARGTGWIRSFLGDIGFAYRILRKDAGFTSIAVLTIALAISANTAVFSVADAILFKPLPYPDPNRIVSLFNLWLKSGGTGPISIPDFRDWHREATAFAAMAYYTDYDTSVARGATTEYVHLARVSLQFFEVFGVEPAAGRLFVEREEKPGSEGAALISYGYWQSRFGGSMDVVGRTLMVYGKPVPVVGILPAGFRFPDKTDVWCPVGTVMQETAERSAPNYLAIGRLKPDVTLASAQAQLAAIAARLEARYPAVNQGKSVRLFPMRHILAGNARSTVYLLLGTVAVIRVLNRFGDHDLGPCCKLLTATECREQ